MKRELSSDVVNMAALSSNNSLDESSMDGVPTNVKKLVDHSLAASTSVSDAMAILLTSVSSTYI